MNDVFSFDLVNHMLRIVPGPRVIRGYIAVDRRQNFKQKK